MAELNQLHNPLRRRSPRLSSPSLNKMAQTSIAEKRSITVRKIAPRKTAVPPEHNKENTPRRTENTGEKVSTPDPVPDRRSSGRRKAAVPSPVVRSPPPTSSQQPAAAPEDAGWLQKVRRSYSRLSDPPSLSDPRDTLFGFEKLNTPEVARRMERSRTALEVSGSGLSSFTSLLETEDCESGFPEPDPNIPGVVVVKERRRRKRKVQQIDTVEMEVLAAKMNAEFEEAEEFQLVVE